MKVKNTELCALLSKLGVDTARGWGAGKTQARINTPLGFSQYVPERLDDLGLSDSEHRLLKKLVAHQKNKGTKIDVEDDGLLPIRARDRHKVKKISPRLVYPPGWTSWDDKKKLAYWSKHPRPLPAAGVASVVVRELLRAGRYKPPRPLTKVYLLAVLKEEFPERDEMGMETNLGNLVPSRLRDVYGLRVERVKQSDGRMGFYAIPAGDS